MISVVIPKKMEIGEKEIIKKQNNIK